jgi:hypothetical protein
MPAPKPKPSAPSAKGEEPAPSGEKKDTSVVLLAGGKPDKQAHEKEQDRIKGEIDALQLKLVRLF